MVGGLQELTEDLLGATCLLRACCFLALCDHDPWSQLPALQCSQLASG